MASTSRSVVSATFSCKVCGAQAETVCLLPKGSSSNPCSSEAILYDFESETMAISEHEAAQVERALKSSNAAILYSAHHRWLCTYCPACQACYCKTHWRIESQPDPQSDWYSMHYDTYGTCPAGHKRLMAKDGLSWPVKE
jgi:hypothetical protein